MYAVIVDGVVAEKRETDTLGPEESAIIVECGSDVEIGYVWDPSSGCRKKTLDERLAYSAKVHEIKREAMKSAILCALAADGENMDATLASLRARWAILADEEALAIETILLEE